MPYSSGDVVAACSCRYAQHERRVCCCKGDPGLAWGWPAGPRDWRPVVPAAAVVDVCPTCVSTDPDRRAENLEVIRTKTPLVVRGAAGGAAGGRRQCGQEGETETGKGSGSKGRWPERSPGRVCCLAAPACGELSWCRPEAAAGAAPKS